MPAQLVELLLRDFDALKSKRVHWENQWQEVSDFSLGRRTFTTEREPGRQRNVRLYDTTARDANTLLAAALHSLLTNPATDWFDIKFTLHELNEIDEAALWLETVKGRMQSAFRRQEAAFTTQMHEVYSDLTGFNTTCMYVDDEVGFGPKFSARPLSEIYIDEDSTGRVSVTYRRFTMKHWQAVDQWGKDAVRAQAAVDNNKGHEEGTYLHLVRKRGAPLPGDIEASGMPWESIYISVDEKKIVSQGGFFENPYMVARWSKDSGEIYGRGPGIDTLPDSKMLNQIWRTYIRNAEKRADPPIMVEDDGIMPGAQVRITPQAVINVRNDNPNGPAVQYLEHRGNFDISDFVIETRTSRIQKAFHSEIIQAFQDPRMTATQVLELAKLSQRILSPVLGRMQTELLDPMVRRVYGIESRTSTFPVAPPEIQGQSLRIEYVSPVARAQKASESQAILDSFAAAAAMAEVRPDALDNIDFDAAIRAIFDGNGVPLSIMRPKRQVISIRRERQEQIEEQEQLEQGLAVADSASKLIPAVTGAAQAQAA